MSESMQNFEVQRLNDAKFSARSFQREAVMFHDQHQQKHHMNTASGLMDFF